MSEKVQLSKLQQISNDELTALQTLNDNFKRIENQFDNVLSRTNESPNNMESDLDMDQHSIINVKSGKGPNDVVVRKDIQDLVDKAEDVLLTADKVLGRVDEKTRQAGDYANKSRIWAEGDTHEVQALGGDYSSKSSAGLSYAYANAPYGVTVEDFAAQHNVTVQGEKGDKGEAGRDGQDGQKGQDGRDATINGQNMLFIEQGKGIIIDQNINTLTISSEVTKDYVDNQIGSIGFALDVLNGEVI